MKTALLLLITLASTALAGDPTIVLQPDGTAWYSAGDGTATIVIYNVIAPPGSPPIVTPDDPDDPNDPPGNPTAVRGLAKGWAEEADDVTGAVLMSEYLELLAVSIDKGTIPADKTSIDKALTEASKLVFKMMPGKSGDIWKKVYLNKITPELSKRLFAGGGELDKSAWVSFFRDVGAGFKDSTEGAAIPGWLAPFIPLLLKLLMELLTGLFP